MGMAWRHWVDAYMKQGRHGLWWGRQSVYISSRLMRQFFCVVETASLEKFPKQLTLDILNHLTIACCLWRHGHSCRERRHIERKRWQ